MSGALSRNIAARQLAPRDVARVIERTLLWRFGSVGRCRWLWPQRESEPEAGSSRQLDLHRARNSPRPAARFVVDLPKPIAPDHSELRATAGRRTIALRGPS